jgi:hypothetical protein
VYWIYTSIWLTVLLCWKRASQKIINRKTAHLQRLACVRITGSMRSTPTAALKVIPDAASPWYLYWGRGKTDDLQTELSWRIYSSKIWSFGGFQRTRLFLFLVEGLKLAKNHRRSCYQTMWRFDLWRRGGCWGVFFQIKVYGILTCSDYYRSANMHNMTICICSDSKADAL